jgi:hypothetical protein
MSANPIALTLTGTSVVSSNLSFGRTVALLALPVTLAGCGGAPPPVVTAALPLKHDPQPTTAAISAADLMTRLYIFADDSMMGREAGTAGHRKGTDYIARELQRLGLRPAGDNGTYFQAVPLIRRAFDTVSTITVEGGPTLRAGVDFVATGGGPGGSAARSIRLQTVYGGAAYDTANMLRADQADSRHRGARVVAARRRLPTGGRPGHCDRQRRCGRHPPSRDRAQRDLAA